MIPWCCSSDDGFLVVSINVSYHLIQSNLLVTLRFLYIFVHWGTNFIFQILKERIRPTWTKNISMYISTLKLIQNMHIIFAFVMIKESDNCIEATSHEQLVFISCMCTFSDVNLSLYVSWRHIQNWRYSSTQSCHYIYIVVSFIQWLLYPQGNSSWYPLSRRLFP